MLWFNNNLENKKIKLYTVSQKENTSNFLTLTLTENEALEYVQRKVFIDHFSHFKLWCDLRKYNIQDIKSQTEYINKCIDKNEYNNYLIHSVKYRYKEILAIMRMFGKCFPLGCSFDTEAEKDYIKDLLYIDKVTKDLCDKIELNFNQGNQEDGK